MKQLIFIFAVAVILTACSNGNANKVFKPESDTAKLWGTYVDFPSKNIVYGITYQITTRTVSVDSFLKVTPVVDTAIFILPSIDTGKQFKRTINGSVTYDRNVDSSIVKVQRWIDANENVFIKDSTKKQ